MKKNPFVEFCLSPKRTAYPPHIHRFEPFLLYGVRNDSYFTLIVNLYWCRRLRMIHFLLRGTHGKVGVAVFEDGPNFSLRIRGHNVK